VLIKILPCRPACLVCQRVAGISHCFSRKWPLSRGVSGL